MELGVLRLCASETTSNLDQPVPKNFMKLDFESNTSTFVPVESDLLNRVESESNSAEVSKMLRQGIEAAQSGRVAEARTWLLRVTEAAPNNEKAWLWLASISEYPEELLVFLNSVLRINPENERALEWAKATKSLLSKTFVQRGIDASNEQTDFAKQCFLQAIVHDNNNEMAWLWLAALASSDKEKSMHLQKVLGINPDNQTAKSLLESINRQRCETLFQKAAKFAVEGETSSALNALAEFVYQHGENEDALLLKSFLVQSFGEKLACFEQVLEMNPENNQAQMNAAFMRSMMEKAEAKDSESAEQMLPVQEVAAEEAREEVFEEEVFAAEESQFADEVQEEFLVTDETEAEEQQMQFEEPQAEEMHFEEAVSSEEREEVFEPRAEFSDETDVEENGYAFYEVREKPDYFALTQVVYSEDGEDETDVLEDFENQPHAYENVEELPQVYAFQEDSPEEVSPQPQFMDDETDVNEVREAADEREVSMESYSQQAENEPMESDSADVYEIEASETVAENNYSHLFENYENSNENSPVAFAETVVNFDENASHSAEQSAATEAETPNYYDKENSFAPQVETVACTFCETENEPQSLVCRSCRAVLTFSDLEMVLGNHEADKEMIGNAICQMEAEKERRELSLDEVKQMALGYLNIGDLPRGLSYLNEAARMNPNDIVLSSQVNALKIRFVEIEKQKDMHSLMPKNLTILVVDDSATVRKLISGKLEKSGHEVFCAIDGVDALEKMKEMIPDLILLDINMPRMDGYQVCKMIRNNEATKDVPVVMISGKDGFFDKVRGRMAGTTGYITKPFGPETLMKTVETYIN